MLAPLLLISYLSMSGFASGKHLLLALCTMKFHYYNTILLCIGFTNLQANPEFACMGETVTFSCTTSHSFLTWIVTFTDQTVGSKWQIFRQGDSPTSLTKFVHGHDQQLHFQLISTANGVIGSILVIQESPLMTNASIQCEGSVIRHLTFKLACKT
jgi:hypothetical protein